MESRSCFWFFFSVAQLETSFLGGGFKHFLFSPLFGEDSYVD